jgi:hypothetical protein
MNYGDIQEEVEAQSQDDRANLELEALEPLAEKADAVGDEAVGRTVSTPD